MIDLWERLNEWIFDTTEIELPLNVELVLFGNLDKNPKNYIRNQIILYGKFYILRTKLNGTELNITALKSFVRENLNFEKQIFYKNKQFQQSNIYWNPWLQIL